MSFIFCSIAVLTTSCKRKVVPTDRASVISYINDPNNGLHQIHDVGNMKIELTYIPWQLVAAKQIQYGSRQHPAPADLKEKLFMKLCFSCQNKELLKQLRFEQYSEMVQVFSFRMKDFISLRAAGQKPLEPLDCLLQQTYGMGRANEILMVFNKQQFKNATDFKITVQEFGLQTGNLEYNFSGNDINFINTLNYNLLYTPWFLKSSIK